MKQSLILIVVIAGALGIGFLVGFPVLQVVGGFDPDTQRVGDLYDLCFGGAFPDVPTDSRKYGEIASRDKVYLSWVSGGLSVPFSVSATSYKCEAGLGATTRAHRYQFDINNGAGFESMRQDDFPSGYIEIQGGDFYQVNPTAVSVREVSLDGTTFENSDGEEEGIRDGAVLRIVFIVGLAQSGGVGACCDWYAVAYDEVQLRYGKPSVSWEADLYEVGEQACVRWTVPFLKDGAASAYYLTVLSLNTNTAVAGLQDRPIDLLSGKVCFPVDASMFTPGEVNRLRAEVYSPIFRAAVQDTATIDDRELAPRVDSVSFNQAEYREGQDITITIRASPNPQSGSPIARYYVLLHVDGEALFDGFSDSPTVTVRASRTGVATAEVTAIDESGRSSAVKRVSATIGNVVVDCELYPELERCRGPTLDLFYIVLAIFVVIGVLLGLFVGRGNLLIAALVVLVFLVIGFLAAGPVADALEGFG